LAVKLVALALLLLAGCGTTRDLAPGPDPRIAHFEEENQTINESENRCISETLASGNGQMASIAASPDAFVGQQTHKLAAKHDRRLSECRANADRERKDLSVRERAYYQDGAQEERDRNSLMMIFTTSTLH
jgi:hypothetical protein